MIFIGDIHGSFKKFFDILVKTEYQNETFIQVGDFGLGFRPIENEISLLNPINDWLRDNNNFLYAIRGNHDNPEYFENSPFELSNIKLLKDFSIIRVENKNILTLGGAISIDRLTRKEGISYWKGEEIPYIIPDIKDLVPDGIKIDVVCTHNCPSFVWPTEYNDIVRHFIKLDKTLDQDLTNERRRLDLLYTKVCEYNGYEPKLWVYGHMHKTVSTQHKNTYFQCCGIDYFYQNNLDM